MKSKTVLVTCLACALAGLALPVQAAHDSVVTAVFSSVSNGYTRKKLPDGSFERETYVVGNGGFTPGAEPDPSAESIRFADVVRLLAGPLSKKSYFPARDGNTADLLLIITWGETVPFDDATMRVHSESFYTAVNDVNMANSAVALSEQNGEPQATPDGIQSPLRTIRDATRDNLEGEIYQMQMFQDMRAKANERNARILGYVQEINAKNNMSRFAGGGNYYNDLISDIEAARYYVVVSAYDYKLALNQKKRKLLWATRVSIQAQGNRFDEYLATMVANAGRNLGENTGHLVRHYQEGKVNLGELKIISTGAEAKPDESAPAQK